MHVYDGITFGVCWCLVGELCGLEEKDGHHILQCAWARVKRVLTDYDFLPVTSKEQASSLRFVVFILAIHFIVDFACKSVLSFFYFCLLTKVKVCLVNFMLRNIAFSCFSWKWLIRLNSLASVLFYVIALSWRIQILVVSVDCSGVREVWLFSEYRLYATCQVPIVSWKERKYTWGYLQCSLLNVARTVCRVSW